MLFKSLFAEVEGARKSTVAYIEKELLKVEGETPTIERVIDAGLTYIGPALQIGLTAIGEPAVAALVGPIVAKAQSDLIVASALVTDLGPTANAAALFADVKTNLSGILTTTGVKSAKTIASVTKAVNEVGVLGSAVQVAATAIATAAATPAAA